MQLSSGSEDGNAMTRAAINSPWSLYYGLCVDAYSNGTREQGVIFDHEDGCHQRLVLFPGTSLLQRLCIENLRITHDLCKGTERWRMRGEWLFLVLIEEYERSSSCVVAESLVRQLWDDVRVTEAFINKIGGWNCWEGLGEHWASLVSQALNQDTICCNAAKNYLTVNESDCDDASSSESESDYEATSSESESASSTLESVGAHSLDVDIEESAAYCPEAVVELYMLEPRAKNLGNLRSKVRKHLLYSKWTLYKIPKKVSGKVRPEMRYKSPKGKVYISLRMACKGCIEEQGLSILQQGTDIKKTSKQSFTKVSARVLKQMHNKRKRVRSVKNVVDDRNTQSSKRVRKVVVSNPAHCISQSILSWLVDTDIQLSRAKVCYKREKFMAHGRVFRNGIKCNCCKKFYGLSSFATHAGDNNYHKPSTHIFLEDGKSLLDFQKQIMVSQENERKLLPHEGFFASPQPCQRRMKSGLAPQENDELCSICHFGGSLLLCDQCPSAFHLNCIGLDELPEGDHWFCPCCRCDICGQTDFNGNLEQFTDKTILYCDQCEREYHVGCVQERGMLKMDSCPKGNWFCSCKCEKIFTDLHGLIGAPIDVGDGLTWTLLKFSDDGYEHAFDTETMVEHQSKLHVALAVMHECFEPIKDVYAKDLVRDILFNRRSTLRRINFGGFYTVVLEKNDELISIATVRVYGGKVAEMPLVGTRVRYRKQGMCRILMNTLEKKLAEFGVEKLILPAVPQVLQTWTTCFGFSKMTDSERSSLHQYIFLDFQKTTMCQKKLKIAKQGSDLVLKQAATESGEKYKASQEDVDSNKCLQFYCRRKKRKLMVQFL